MTRDIFAVRNEVIGFDVLSGLPYPEPDLSRCDFLVLCVGTPPSPDGSAGLDQVRRAVADAPAGVPLVLRSTVPPGTTDRLIAEFSREIFFWPEYVGESKFSASTWEPLNNEPFQILGGAASSAFTTLVDFIAETVGPMSRLHLVSTVEAEITKYMENSYFAVKTTFVNEFRLLTESLGQDWQKVREGWLLDPRVERDHSDAFASSPGFGGRCLPKDLSAIISMAESIDLPVPLLRAVQTINDERYPPSARA
jgi:nucleotide sugar dehydrogenase